MLKRIDVSDVELGMFIHKLEGNWFKHPFWQSRFLLEDPDTLGKLQTSDVDRVIIDISKGKDTRPAPVEQKAEPAVSPSVRPPAAFSTARSALPRRRPAPHASAASGRAGTSRSIAPLGVAREFGNAKLVAGQSRKVISKVFLEARLGKAVKASDVEPVVEDIYASVQRNANAFNGLLHCQRDSEFVYRHALAVCALMILLARQMKLTPQEIRHAGMAGLFLDIGVGLLPVDLASTGGDYRKLPANVLEQHVAIGCDALVAAGDIPEEVLQVCRQHHERMDGSGYPQSLQGPEIDLFSRMAAICDSFDSLIADGPSERGLDPASALRVLAGQEAAFDQEVLRHFIEAVGVYPVGAFVKLRSDRLAMVVDVERDDHALPTVRTFYSLELDKRIRGETIALSRCYGEDAIVGTADLQGLVLPELSQLRELIFLAACKTGS